MKRIEYPSHQQIMRRKWRTPEDTVSIETPESRFVSLMGSTVFSLSQLDKNVAWFVSGISIDAATSSIFCTSVISKDKSKSIRLDTPVLLLSGKDAESIISSVLLRGVNSCSVAPISAGLRYAEEVQASKLGSTSVIHRIVNAAMADLRRASTSHHKGRSTRRRVSWVAS